jgi:hypothetical protein
LFYGIPGLANRVLKDDQLREDLLDRMNKEDEAEIKKVK